MRRCLTLAVSVVLLLAVSPSAGAATVKQSDSVGDARTNIDLKSVTYINNDESVAFVFKFVNLRATTRAEAQFYTDFDNPFYGVYVSERNGRPSVEFYEATALKKCPGIRAQRNERADTVRLNIPKLCLYGPGALHMSAGSRTFVNGKPFMDGVQERLVERG